MKIQIILLVTALLQVVNGNKMEPTIVKIDVSTPTTLYVTKGACSKSKYDKTYHVNRGDILRVNVPKNNRYGGFMRFSMVPSRYMYRKEAHQRLSFFFTCADNKPTKCNNRKDILCLYDRKGEHYQHYVPVPKVYPNGIFVLGIARYGSYTKLGGTAKALGYGDYFGCVRIRVHGGPLKYKQNPTFTSAHSITGRAGYCRSTLTKICSHHLHSSEKHVSLVRPDEFTKRIKPILQKSLYKRVSNY